MGSTLVLMNHQPSNPKLQALGEAIARDVARQQQLEEFLSKPKPRFWLPTLGSFAFFPAASMYYLVEVPFGARVVLALSVAAAFGVMAEHLRVKSRLEATTELLLLLAKRR